MSASGYAPRTAPAVDPQPESTDVLVRTDGALGRLTLNRPKAINALTLEMVRQLHVGLDRFEADPDITVVLIDGAGERGLCAGGDIVALYDSVRDGSDSARIFWTEEYVLNARIARFPKPIVAVLDGIVMGGGIGLGGHASHRLATERLVSAMPEVGIGFAPDVGGTWLFTRIPGELGTHLALTGARLGAHDAVAAGLADRIISSEAVDELAADLALGDLAAALERAESVPVDAPAGDLADARDWIAQAYVHDTVEAIVAALQARPEEAAHKAATQILRASPTSLKVTLRALREAADLPSLEVALRHELRISCGFTTVGDFVEGVRAQVVDKDRTPRWDPARLEDVSPDTVDHFFAPLGDHDLDLDADRTRTS
ncbi:MAG: enoyl-CoA hydratase/isomerase family protein [Solirubrobacteraceae bacterium]|nr:enoyl-CoA hydratase/isomerase family protein [Patulibacter sp.]